MKKPKYCPDCKTYKTNFGINRSRCDGLQGICKDCKKIRAKEYNNTVKGFLSQTYNSMRQRTKSPNTKHKKYKGLPVLDRSLFFEWSINNKQFNTLFNNWKIDKKYNKIPSIDRIDPNNGYILGNIQWITQGENSGKTRRSKNNSI